MSTRFNNPAAQIWLVIAVIVLGLGGLGWEWHNAHACIHRPENAHSAQVSR